MLEDDKVTPLEILGRVRQGFEHDIANPSPFVTYRGIGKTEIRSSNGTRDYVQGYLETLPTFEGMQITGLVDVEIHNREELARETGKPYNPVSIVDLGYGNGKFLLDAREKWGIDVELTGYGNDRYTKIPQLYSYQNGGVHYPPTEPALRNAQVKLVNGNAIDIRKVLGDNSADFIVSSYALMYVHYPEWEMIKKIYRVLSPNGIALLDIDTNSDLSVLEKFLEENGYNFEWSEKGVSFRKTHPDINLPVRTSWTRFSVPELIISGDSVGERGLEPPTSRSQTARSTN